MAAFARIGENDEEPSLMTRRAELLMPPILDALARDTEFQSLPPDAKVEDAVCQTTFFFREPRVLLAFKTSVLPAFDGRERISIASVGASSGQEPYSLLLDNWEDRERLEIRGFELNSDRIRQAEAGTYREWNEREHFRRLREIVNEFPEIGIMMTPTGDANYTNLDVGDNVRRRVGFSKWDIVESPLPAQADVVLLNYVLMHYNTAGREMILENVRRSLPLGGWLVCEPSTDADDEQEWRDYAQWMRDIRYLGFERAPVTLPGYVIEDQTESMQVYRRIR